MLTSQEIEDGKQVAADYFRKAGIHITDQEKQRIEIADFGLGELNDTGLYVLTYVNTQRCCAKELAMSPRQTCPEHLHPPVGNNPGKEETFRCRWGKVFVYVDGAPTPNPQAKAPAGREQTYKVWHEIELNPGDQYTLVPGTWHWFQAGDEGAVVSEFSTRSTDENDNFTDPEIARFTKVADEA